MLHIVVHFRDASRLDLRDYVFADGRRKYAYHWMNVDGTLRCRWDNSPHWPNIVLHRIINIVRGGLFLNPHGSRIWKTCWPISLKVFSQGYRATGVFV
jgi:hypothetical protein